MEEMHRKICGKDSKKVGKELEQEEKRERKKV